MYSMMQQEGRVQFLKYHLGTVRGVAFCPKVGIFFFRNEKLKLGVANCLKTKGVV